MFMPPGRVLRVRAREQEAKKLLLKATGIQQQHQRNRDGWGQQDEAQQGEKAMLRVGYGSGFVSGAGHSTHIKQDGSIKEEGKRVV